MFGRFSGHCGTDVDYEINKWYNINEVTFIHLPFGRDYLFRSKITRREKFRLRLVTAADHLSLMLESDRAEVIISIVASLGAYINSYREAEAGIDSVIETV